MKILEEEELDSLGETAARKERYVAPLYNYMISKGQTVRISDVDAEYVHVLGTPEELQVFLNE